MFYVQVEDLENKNKKDIPLVRIRKTFIITTTGG